MKKDRLSLKWGQFEGEAHGKVAVLGIVVLALILSFVLVKFHGNIGV